MNEHADAEAKAAAATHAVPEEIRLKALKRMKLAENIQRSAVQALMRRRQVQEELGDGHDQEIEEMIPDEPEDQEPGQQPQQEVDFWDDVFGAIDPQGEVEEDPMGWGFGFD